MEKTPKKWVLKPVDEEKAQHLHQSLKIHPNLCRLLVQRGITSFDEARGFFRPSLENLHDPFLMLDMEKAVSRLKLAIEQNEKILIYGDYDVDGTTAVTIVYSFLKQFYNNLGYYIPNRYTEGYGISFRSIDYAEENGYTLIIALDCGIKEIEKVEKGTEKGIDMIICDHHKPGDSIPAAVAVLDPLRSDCTYPYKYLSGAGIGFKLIQAFASINNIPQENVLSQLDAVAISIAADIVPVTGENRILIYYGLKQLNENPRKGIKALIDKSGLSDKTITCYDLGFVLGPRINAAGRMEEGSSAVKLLIAEDEDGAADNAHQLNENNKDRRETDQQILLKALEIINQNHELKTKKTTVLCQPHWHKGVIGIVASKMLDYYYRPTIIFTESNGVLAGSARSVRDFDIYEALWQCKDLLIQFGGHMYAAGMTLAKENFEAFCEKFEEVVAASVTEDHLVPVLEADLELELHELSDNFNKILQQFGPFGPGNGSPVFVSKKVIDSGYSKIVKDKHLKLCIKQGQSNQLFGIGFEMAQYYPYISGASTGSKSAFDICYSIEPNEWQGRINYQLRVKDIRVDIEKSTK